MAWTETLDVAGGHLLVEPTAQPDTYRIHGLLECDDSFLVWFQHIEYDEHLVGGEEFLVAKLPCRFTVIRETSEGKSAICLAPWKGPQHGDPPANSLSLCKRLLAPSRGQDHYGYRVSALLYLEGSKYCNFTVLDRFYDGRDRDFVEFAHFTTPYTLVAHGKESSYTARQLVQLVLKLQHEWPLDIE